MGSREDHHAHTRTYIHTRTQHPPAAALVNAPDTFYPGTRSTRQRTRNGRCERRPCWTGLRSPHTRLVAAAAPPSLPPAGRSVRPPPLPSSLPPSLPPRDGLAQGPAASARQVARRVAAPGGTLGTGLEGKARCDQRSLYELPGRQLEPDLPASAFASPEVSLTGLWENIQHLVKISSSSIFRRLLPRGKPTPAGKNVQSTPQGFFSLEVFFQPGVLIQSFAMKIKALVYCR